jgi:hypothetical protein
LMTTDRLRCRHLGDGNRRARRARSGSPFVHIDRQVGCWHLELSGRFGRCSRICLLRCQRTLLRQMACAPAIRTSRGDWK